MYWARLAALAAMVLLFGACGDDVKSPEGGGGTAAGGDLGEGGDNNLGGDAGEGGGAGEGGTGEGGAGGEGGTPAEPSCSDGEKNGDETDVDCGGSCGACADGLACDAAADCVSGVCDEGVCAAPSCDDEVRNGAETGVDCGGGDCSACNPDETCEVADDCVTGVCVEEICRAASCSDETKNGDETDVDCGGSCGPCDEGAACEVGGDCGSGVCSDSVCAAAACDDEVKNGDETDVDCGGSCEACADGLACDAAADCASGVCKDGICVQPACDDGEQNGDETDVDCGGSCGPCAIGDACDENGDCESGVCDEGGSCVKPLCENGTKDPGETDVDCGGVCETLCGGGRSCDSAADCKSGVCTGGLCRSPECNDGVQNGNETGVDCGGDCPAGCEVGGGCAVDEDCAEGTCDATSICVAPFCGDGVVNQDIEECDLGAQNGGLNSSCTAQCEWAGLRSAILVANFGTIDILDSATGAYVGVFSSSPDPMAGSFSAKIVKPGPDGRIWVLEGSRLMRFDVDGTYIDTFVTGQDWNSANDFDFTADEVLVAMRGGFRRISLATGLELGNVATGLDFASTNVQTILVLPDGRIAGVFYDTLKVISADYTTATTIAPFSQSANGMVLVGNDTVYVSSNLDAVDEPVLWWNTTTGATGRTGALGGSLEGITLLDNGDLLVSQDSWEFPPPRLRRWTPGSTSSTPINIPHKMRRMSRVEIAPTFFPPN